MIKADFVNPLRPQFCPEINCKCLNSTCFTEDLFANGGSFFCTGKVLKPEKIRFQDSKTDHHNNYHFCIWTTMKGWLKIMVNHYDLYLMIMGVNSILRDEGEPEIETDFNLEEDVIQ